jgi:formate dehydrogenase subunit gamma
MIRIFSSLWRAKPVRHEIKICHGEACQAMGTSKLTEHARTYLGLDFNETNGADHIKLEPIYCTGYCARAPVVVIDKKIYGEVTAEEFDELVDSLDEGQISR